MNNLHGSLTPARLFSSTTSHFARGSRSTLERLHRDVPEYPYGPALWYKKANFGLYGGSHIQFGNTVSEKFELKNRRRWKPNVHNKQLWSASLGRFLRVKITARALRTVDKVGGLDEYLLGEKPARLKELGMSGWLLRWRIMQTEVVRERFRAERVRLGLSPANGAVRVGKEGGSVEKEAEEAEEMEEEERRGPDGRFLTAKELRQEIEGLDRELDDREAAADRDDVDPDEAVDAEGERKDHSKRTQPLSL
ncbi:MAG: 39S ribosomal protein L24, mitochondrial [Thelocarpon superellum]|nr:MAG: 39S ribosomal protein L24, mitochondrial [Thelocarpon superellum]